jgi:hypothetical protein
MLKLRIEKTIEIPDSSITVEVYKDLSGNRDWRLINGAKAFVFDAFRKHFGIHPDSTCNTGVNIISAIRWVAEEGPKSEPKGRREVAGEIWGEFLHRACETAEPKEGGPAGSKVCPFCGGEIHADEGTWGSANCKDDCPFEMMRCYVHRDFRYGEGGEKGGD